MFVDCLASISLDFAELSQVFRILPTVRFLDGQKYVSSKGSTREVLEKFLQKRPTKDKLLKMGIMIEKEGHVDKAQSRSAFQHEMSTFINKKLSTSRNS